MQQEQMQVIEGMNHRKSGCCHILGQTGVLVLIMSILQFSAGCNDDNEQNRETGNRPDKITHVEDDGLKLDFHIIHQSDPASLPGTGRFGQSPDSPVTGVWKVDIVAALPEQWRIQLKAHFKQAIRKNDTMVASFYARAISVPVDRKSGRIDLLVEEDGNWQNRILDYPFSPNSMWQKYQVAFKASRNISAGKCTLILCLADQVQTLEIGGLHFTNYGQDRSIMQFKRTPI